MNKLFIVFLAVCLVSVHAFVKRDAEAPNNESSDVLKKVQDTFSNINKELQGLIDPEQIKKGFNDAIESVNKALKDLQSKQEGGKA